MERTNQLSTVVSFDVYNIQEDLFIVQEGEGEGEGEGLFSAISLYPLYCH